MSSFEEWWPYHPTKGEFDADDLRAAYAAGAAQRQLAVDFFRAQLADARAETQRTRVAMWESERQKIAEIERLTRIVDGEGERFNRAIKERTAKLSAEIEALQTAAESEADEIAKLLAVVEAAREWIEAEYDDSTEIDHAVGKRALTADRIAEYDRLTGERQ